MEPESSIKAILPNLAGAAVDVGQGARDNRKPAGPGG